MRQVGGVVLTVTGVLACPCSLVLLLPALLSLLAGTALGSVLSQHTGLVYVTAGTYFMGACTLGALLLLGARRSPTREDAACPTCATLEGDPKEKRPHHLSSSLSTAHVGQRSNERSNERSTEQGEDRHANTAAVRSGDTR
jgi:hypothetical protein